MSPAWPSRWTFVRAIFSGCPNYAALHSRTSFSDHPEPQRRRHLLRLWLHRDSGRPVVAGFGKNGVVQHRERPRNGGAEHSEARFRVTDSAVPRLIS